MSYFLVLSDLSTNAVKFTYSECNLSLNAVDDSGPNADAFITECIDFQPIRVNYYSTSDISQLFHRVHPSSILQYFERYLFV